MPAAPTSATAARKRRCSEVVPRAAKWDGDASGLGSVAGDVVAEGEAAEVPRGRESDGEVMR
jgi:hypothetical protein